jgi:hypothetical protein
VTARDPGGTTPGPAGRTDDARAEWLIAGSIWWGGELRGPGALRLTGGVAAGDGPVPVAGVPAGARLRRLPGTLLPGLRDAHVHSALADMPTVRAGGIAAVWDLGGVPERVAALRDRAADPGLRLPRMRIAGPFLTAPGGYPSDRPWAPAGSVRGIRSAAEAAAAVAACRAIGADLVKVTAHAGGPQLPAGTLRAVVAAAHDGPGRLDVVVHAEGGGTVEAAVAAGADLLAHTPWTARLGDPLLRAAAAAGMTWISTLDIHGWGEPTPEQDVAVDNLRRFRAYGGTVIYGTDLGNGPLVPGVNPREIRALQRAGLTPDDVLTAMTGDATGVPPCWVAGGLDLDPGRFADVLATARVVGPELRPRVSG